MTPLKTLLSVFLAMSLAIPSSWSGEERQNAAGILPRLLPGMLKDGRVQLPNQWMLNPAGRQMALGDLPMNMQTSPDGRYLAITHSGVGKNEIVITELSPKGEDKVVSRVEMNNLWYGLAWSSDGNKLYASGGKDDILYAFDFKDGYLSGRRDIDLFKEGKKILPTGIALSKDGRSLYTANCVGSSVGILNLEAETPSMEAIALPSESYPYSCVLSPDERMLYVSLWGAAKVAEIDLFSRHVHREIPAGQHPNEIILTRDGSRLFVSNANDNSVSLIDTKEGKVTETIHSALYPNAPEGSTPNSLALDPEEEHLLIANADNNNLAVFEVEQGKPAQSRGFIPVGWYPTSVRVHPETRRIYVANGKGQTSKANVNGPQPILPMNRTNTEYIGAILLGTLSDIEWPDNAALANHTKNAYACSPYLGKTEATVTPEEGNPIPKAPGQTSPIKHCIYIIKENRTYDQVFGDIEKGNGDPRLCIFPEKVTPNLHALVNTFVLLDNFYVDAEVSADGHEWSMAAYATDFVEKQWPSEYGHEGRWKLGYPAEGAFKIAAPSAGYIWDQCAKAGLSYRNYGEFIEHKEGSSEPGRAKVEGLKDHFDPMYRGFDLSYSDLDRNKEFFKELAEFEKNGDLPRFIVLQLPNDHTSGTRKGARTPLAMVAENDLALGQVIEALSHSRFWPELAVFVIEDDAQNGPDHVDAHRTEALVISPYCRRGIVDSNLYSTTSMLRTMELILGLEPMSQFDAAARPMFASFTAQPDLAPYQCLPAKVDIHEMNVATAWGAQESMAMNLDEPDAADDFQLNEIIWKSVCGPDSEMPAPVRAAFVFPLKNEEEEE
jgi:YVTN family beta-propeller protein